MLKMKRVTMLPQIVFQRRTERLDWRKIASVDIEKLMVEGDGSVLEELIKQIVFCRAESEFDEDRTDPGFIKVFRLSQLIGEYLIFSHQKDKDKLTICEEKSIQLEEQNVKLTDEIGVLKENLASAKKELKRRKELLASTQNEVLGSNNQDEFDQCPYCPKRFLTPFYLHAHIQRRHQGLPLHPSFQSLPNNHGGVIFPFPPQGTEISIPGPGGTMPSTSTSPAIYAFTMSPNGTVKQKEQENTNLSPENKTTGTECNISNLQERRDSSTQTFIIPSVNNSSDNLNLNVNSPSDGEFVLKNHQNETGRQEWKRGSEDVISHIKSPSPHFSEQISEYPHGHEEHTLHNVNTNEKVFGISNNISVQSRKDPSASTSVLREGDRFNVSRVDLNTICDLVEKYLEQKSIASQNQHYDKILSSIHQSRDQFTQNHLQQEYDTHVPTKEERRGNPPSEIPISPNTKDFIRQAGLISSNVNANGSSGSNTLTGTGTAVEEVEENVMRLKDEFETQWTHLSQKINDSGIQLLKGDFLTQINKVQEMIQKSPRAQSKVPATSATTTSETGDDKSGPQPVPRAQHQIDEEGEVKDINSPTSTSPNAAVELQLEVKNRVEERLQKQEMRLEQLTNTLQAQMQEELQLLRGRLENQESSWRSKLQSVEDEHEIQIAKLQEHLQAKANAKTNANAISKVKSNSFEESESNREGLMLHRAPSNVSKASKGIQIPDQDSIPNSSQMSNQNQSQMQSVSESKQTKFSVDKPVNSTPISQLNLNERNREIIATANTDVDSGSFMREIPVKVPIAKPRKNQIPEISVEISGERESKGGIRTTSESSVKRGINEGDESCSSDGEGEYLTIIHAEGDSSTSRDRKGETTSKTQAKTKTTKFTEWTQGNQPQLHEYEKPANLHNLDEVSEYTLSASALDNQDNSDDDGESSSDRSESISHKDCSHLEHHQPSSGNRQESVIESEGRGDVKKKYVFDSLSGKIIEACETRSQMDLVRERAVINEMDNQIQQLGINPQANSIGLQEMARALKHLKADRRSIDHQGLEEFESQRNSLNQEVKYEVAKRSIHQKLEKYGNIANSKQDASPLANIFSKVKKSGTSLKRKVASAMKRKRNSPPPKPKPIKSEFELKRTFFSKWGAKRKQNQNPSEINKKKGENAKTLSPSSDSEEGETSSDESSVDIEMPPFMSKSKPILPPNDGKSQTHKISKRRTKRTISSQSLNDSNNSSQDEQIYNKGPKPLTQNQNQLQGDMISELKAKLGQKQNQEHFLEQNSPYKGPNFFVKASPLKASQSPNKNKSQIQVTSNGWGLSSSKSFSEQQENCNENGRRAFKRDLLQEFLGEEGPIRGNRLQQKQQKQTKIRLGMEKVVEDEEDDYTSESEMSSHSQVSEGLRGKKRNFARLDERRKGFRNRKSSYSDSDDGHGRTQHKIINLINQERRLKAQDEDKGHYETLRHHHHQNQQQKYSSSPSLSRERIQKKPNVVYKEKFKGQRSPSKSSLSTLDDSNSSDTSVWETEEEEEFFLDQDQNKNQRITDSSIRQNMGQEINEDESESYSTLQKYKPKSKSKEIDGKDETRGESQSVNGGNYRTNERSDFSLDPKQQRSNCKAKARHTRADVEKGKTYGKSPLDNSWDSD